MIDTHFTAPNPAAVGIDPDKLELLVQRVAQDVNDGVLPAAQMAIARHGKIAALRTFGAATDNALFNVFSSTKAITSAAGWLLIQDSKLSIDERVCDIVPQFGTHGKDVIKVEWLFTHTAGFPNAPFAPLDWQDSAKRNARYAAWRPNWEPNTRYEYHPTSSMWVIAEIIERRSDMEFADFVRSRIADPLGLTDLWLGCPREQHHRIAPVMHCNEAMTPAELSAAGLPPPVEGGEVTEEFLTAFNRTDYRQVPVPGAGGITSAAELALFYQALVNNGRALDGTQVWREDTLAHALEVRNNFADLMGIPVNRALGVVIAGDERRAGRGFGHTNSPAAFGHGGAGGQIAWADPATGISFAYCTNGHDRHLVRQARRGISLSNRAAVCALATN